jgi:hypothetical protein
MRKILSTQLKNSVGIRNILKEMAISLTLADGRKIDTLLVHLPFKPGSTQYSIFFQEIKDGILHNFVFSCKEVEKKLGLKSKKSAEDLFDKAIRKLSQKTAQGELGELILFTLLDVYLNAPKILSKVSLKTNSRMPVFGADAVHGQFWNGKFRLYLGESKLYKNFKPAAAEAAISIKNALEKYEQEFDLLDSHMDFPNIDSTLEEELLKLLNPFSNNDLSEIIYSPCFIGFAKPELFSAGLSEAEFHLQYTELAKDYVEDFFKKIENQKIKIDKTALLLLPFKCVDELVQEFIDFMGIDK